MTEAKEHDVSKDYHGPLPHGWSGGMHKVKWWRDRLHHLYTLTKPCAQCGCIMKIDVTKAAIEGTAKNAGLRLKRCQTCRDASKTIGTSRPVVDETAVGELGELRTANAAMKEELAAAYADNRELRARLGRYELTPALEAAFSASTQKWPWD